MTERVVDYELPFEPSDEPRAFGRHRELFRLLLEDKPALGASVFLLVVIVCAIAGPDIAPHNYLTQDIDHRLAPPFWKHGGHFTHLLGTDYLGRDVFSQIIVASRISVVIGLTTVAITGAVGTTLGVIAGYFRSWVDHLVSGLTDIVMSFPGILLVLALIAMEGPSERTIIVALSIRYWAPFARLSRSLTLHVRESEYVAAAQGLGGSDIRIMRRHVLPNILSPIFVLAILQIGWVMLSEAAISFLGLGIQPPAISWGLMMANGRDYLDTAWWLVTFPGLALFLTILSLVTLQHFFQSASDRSRQPRRRSRANQAEAPAVGA